MICHATLSASSMCIVWAEFSRPSKRFNVESKADRVVTDAQYLKLGYNKMLFRPRPLRPRTKTNFGVARRVWLADAQQMHFWAAIWELELQLEFWSRCTSRTAQSGAEERDPQ